MTETRREALARLQALRTGQYAYQTLADGLCAYATKAAAIRHAQAAATSDGEHITVYSPTGKIVAVAHPTPDATSDAAANQAADMAATAMMNRLLPQAAPTEVERLREANACLLDVLRPMTDRLEAAVRGGWMRRSSLDIAALFGDDQGLLDAADSAITRAEAVAAAS